MDPPANTTSDDALDQFIRGNPVSSSHLVGTAVVPSKGATFGVVDLDLLVKGSVGLRIVDASIMVYYLMLCKMKKQLERTREYVTCCGFKSRLETGAQKPTHPLNHCIHLKVPILSSYPLTYTSLYYAMSYERTAKIAGTIIVGTGACMLAVPLILPAVGFGSTGIVAGKFVIVEISSNT